jgi:hypothetical protein
MNDWIPDRPPTVEEVADDEKCVVHLIDNHGMSIVGGKFVREEWKYFDRWFKIPDEPPELEMPDEIYVGTSDGRFGREGKWSDRAFPDAILYVRKDCFIP